VLYLSDIGVGSNSITRPNISRHQVRRLDRGLSRTTQVLESIFPSVILGGTIAVRQSIGLSMDGFKRSRTIYI
jgi:hypothetical protein